MKPDKFDILKEAISIICLQRGQETELSAVTWVGLITLATHIHDNYDESVPLSGQILNYLKNIGYE